MFKKLFVLVLFVNSLYSYTEDDNLTSNYQNQTFLQMTLLEDLVEKTNMTLGNAKNISKDIVKYYWDTKKEELGDDSEFITTVENSIVLASNLEDRYIEIGDKLYDVATSKQAIYILAGMTVNFTALAYDGIVGGYADLFVLADWIGLDNDIGVYLREHTNSIVASQRETYDQLIRLAVETDLGLESGTLPFDEDILELEWFEKGLSMGLGCLAPGSYMKSTTIGNKIYTKVAGGVEVVFQKSADKTVEVLEKTTAGKYIYVGTLKGLDGLNTSWNSVAKYIEDTKLKAHKATLKYLYYGKIGLSNMDVTLSSVLRNRKFIETLNSKLSGQFANLIKMKNLGYANSSELKEYARIVSRINSYSKILHKANKKELDNLYKELDNISDMTSVEYTNVQNKIIDITSKIDNIDNFIAKESQYSTRLIEDSVVKNIDQYTNLKLIDSVPMIKDSIPISKVNLEKMMAQNIVDKNAKVLKELEKELGYEPQIFYRKPNKDAVKYYNLAFKDSTTKAKTFDKNDYYFSTDGINKISNTVDSDLIKNDIDKWATNNAGKVGFFNHFKDYPTTFDGFKADAVFNSEYKKIIDTYKKQVPDDLELKDLAKTYNRRMKSYEDMNTNTSWQEPRADLTDPSKYYIYTHDTTSGVLYKRYTTRDGALLSNNKQAVVGDYDLHDILDKSGNRIEGDDLRVIMTKLESEGLVEHGATANWLDDTLTSKMNILRGTIDEGVFRITKDSKAFEYNFMDSILKFDGHLSPKLGAVKAYIDDDNEIIDEFEPTIDEISAYSEEVHRASSLETKSIATLQLPYEASLTDKTIDASLGDEVIITFDKNYIYKEKITNAASQNKVYKIKYTTDSDESFVEATYDLNSSGLKFTVPTNEPFTLINMQYPNDTDGYTLVGLPDSFSKVSTDNDFVDNTPISASVEEVDMSTFVSNGTKSIEVKMDLDLDSSSNNVILNDFTLKINIDGTAKTSNIFLGNSLEEMNTLVDARWESIDTSDGEYLVIYDSFNENNYIFFFVENAFYKGGFTFQIVIENVFSHNDNELLYGIIDEIYLHDNINGESINVQIDDIIIKKTGQITSYGEFDDGYYQSGVENNITKDTITIDNVTNLMWHNDYNSATKLLNFNDAKQYCEDSTLGGYTDWLLPSIYQLKTIIDYSKDAIKINKSYFMTNDEYGSMITYWSSTPLEENNVKMWSIHFRDGTTGWTSTYENLLTRCVRIKND